MWVRAPSVVPDTREFYMKSKKETIQELVNTNVNNTKLSIFTEKLETQCPLIQKIEFMFQIENSTTKTINFLLNDLYKIFLHVQGAFIAYIEENIISELKNNTHKVYQIEIEAEGSSQKEIEYKDKLYDFHLNRISSKYTDLKNNIICTHDRIDNIHVLSFFKLV
jgi:hypothetical protein